MEMDEVEVTEAASLREIAKNMNIKVGNLQDVDKLKALIAEKETPKVEMTPRLLKQKKRKAQELEHMKLVSIRLSPMSPFERQLPSTTIDVGNNVLGSIKRTIQFNEPWHVEQIVLNALREKKFRSKKERVDPTTRRTVYTNTMAKSYAIEILPDLTKVELAELAARQAATGAID
jgi:hypothetical protein